jgi:hypothetical protein
MGKPQDRYRRIVKEVCADLKIEADSDLCKHVATLRLARENMQSKLLLGERVDIKDMLDLDAALKKYLPEREAPEIEIKIVSGVVGVYVCQHCHKRNEISDKPFTKPPNPNASTTLHSNAVADTAASAAPAEPPKPVENGPTVAGYREGVSASPIHASVLSNGEVPPLNKLQPSLHARRDVSPLSTPSNDPAPRRHNAPPQGSALDDPNPLRSNGKA